VSLDELRAAGWRRLLAAARTRLELRPGALEGSVSVGAPSDEERRVIIGITGTHRSARAARLWVPLEEIDAYLRNAYGRDLVSVLSALDGVTLRDRPAERAREAEARQAATALANGCRHAGSEWYQRWLDQITADGTLTRVIRHSPRQMEHAVSILDALPAGEVPLAVLAERVTGDTKALTGTPLASLVLRALAIWHDLPGETAQEQRALWDSAGVIVDDLASQVLVLNLPAGGGLLGDWLTSAATQGIPLRVTLHQLRLSPVTPMVAEIFVCENPAVLRAAAGQLGSRCAPLVCTEGVASVACRRLIAAAAGHGVRIHWRNDFDWPGLRMTASAAAAFGTAPWRMSADDYRAAVTADSTLLRGAPAPSPWDPELAQAMAANGRTVMEERLLSPLLSDLSQPSR